MTVSDDTLAVLAEMKTLRVTNAAGSAAHARGAQRQLKQLTHLKRLTLDGIDIPDSDVEKLRLQLPQTDVKWTLAPNESRQTSNRRAFRRELGLRPRFFHWGALVAQPSARYGGSEAEGWTKFNFVSKCVTK